MFGGGGQDRTCVEAVFVVVVLVVTFAEATVFCLFKSICGDPEPSPSLIIPGMVRHQVPLAQCCTGLPVLQSMRARNRRRDPQIGNCGSRTEEEAWSPQTAGQVHRHTRELYLRDEA